MNQNSVTPPSSPAPAPTPGPGAPKSVSAMGVTSLVLGLLAIISSWMPFINNFSFLLAVLGIVFGIVGLVGVVRGKKGGKGIVIAGLVLGILSFVIVLVTQSMYSAAIDEALSESSSRSAVSSSSSTAQPPASSSNGGAADSTADKPADAATAQPQPSSDAQSGSAQPEPAPEPEPEPASDCAVTIDGYELGTDYQGNSAIIVTYTFTNNSDKDRSFIVAVRAKAFQNGVELQDAIGTDADTAPLMSDVKPGATITVQEAYVLADESDVLVECSESFSLDDTLLAEETFSIA